MQPLNFLISRGGRFVQIQIPYILIFLVLNFSSFIHTDVSAKCSKNDI